MAVFKVDTDILSDTVTAYQTAYDDIKKAVKDADQAIDALKKSGWKSNASKAFFDNFDNGWKKRINQRLEVIEHLHWCLENAKTDYDRLCSDASGVGNNL